MSPIIRVHPWLIKTLLGKHNFVVFPCYSVMFRGDEEPARSHIFHVDFRPDFS